MEGHVSWSTSPIPCYISQNWRLIMREKSQASFDHSFCLKSPRLLAPEPNLERGNILPWWHKLFEGKNLFPYSHHGENRHCRMYGNHKQRHCDTKNNCSLGFLSILEKERNGGEKKTEQKQGIHGTHGQIPIEKTNVFVNINWWIEFLQQGGKPPWTTLDLVGFNHLNIGLLVDTYTVWYPKLQLSKQ